MISEKDIRNAIQTSVMGFDVEKLKNDEDFIDAGMDSLDHLSILLNLEESYGVKKIPDEDLDLCRSINGILDYLSR